MDLEQARFNMIEQQIRPWDVSDAHVLELLSVVKREDFMPLAHKALAFVDMEIPLGVGNEVMLAPRLQARLVQDALVQKHEKVLQIGAGTGYMTALLAHRAQSVVAMEIEPELVKIARANLDKAGVSNAEVREADGSKGSQSDAPFDVIVLCGSVLEMPQILLDQVKVGGRIIGLVGGDDTVMRATLMTRTSASTWTCTQPWDTQVPRLRNFIEPSRFQF